MMTTAVPPSGNAALHPESDFRAAMAAAGLDFPGDIIPDGHLHRVKVNGDHNPNGWYVLHLDGLPAGSYGCWKRGFTETWCAKSGDVLTEAERADRAYCHSRTADERSEALERYRQITYGYDPTTRGRSRFFEVVEFTPL